MTGPRTRPGHGGGSTSFAPRGATILQKDSRLKKSSHFWRHAAFGRRVGTVDFSPTTCPLPASARFRADNPNSLCSLTHFWSRHPGGSNFLFGDGSVRFIKYSINDNTLEALATRNQGEVLSADSY